MSNDEKKFSLDDLPDEGSSSSSEKPSASPSRPKVSQKPEPRVERLKRFDDVGKTEKMVQKWLFDVPERSWGWLIAVGVLLVMEKLQIYKHFLEESKSLSEATMGFSEVVTDMMALVDYALIHPFSLAILIPFIFKFSHRSEYYFEVTFDGLQTVQKITLAKGEMPGRVRIKWGEIEQVKKVLVNKREVLEIYSPTAKMGELIWHLESHQKVAVKQLVKGLLSPKNPFRIFIEKEVT